MKKRKVHLFTLENSLKKRYSKSTLLRRFGIPLFVWAIFPKIKQSPELEVHGCANEAVATGRCVLKLRSFAQAIISYDHFTSSCEAKKRLLSRSMDGSPFQSVTCLIYYCATKKTRGGMQIFYSLFK